MGFKACYKVIFNIFLIEFFFQKKHRGNANACTGEVGLKNAQEMAKLAAKELGCDPYDVFVGSTGIIGVNLPMDKMAAGIKAAAAELSEDGSVNAGNAIITTDTYSKACSFAVQIGGKEVRFGAIAKGSGMIQPNMATMLCYISTDANIAAPLLQKTLSDIVEVTFNMISVDGDTSTNDSIFLLANGASGVEIKTEEDKKALAGLIEHICLDITRRIASDGEGAQHLIEVEAYDLPTEHDARLVAKSIAGSMLFKAAVFGRDANWGRILDAMGYSGFNFTPEKTSVSFVSRSGAKRYFAAGQTNGGEENRIKVFDNGVPLDFDEEAAKAILSEEAVEILVELSDGDACGTAWGCDLTYDYVKINGDYRT